MNQLNIGSLCSALTEILARTIAEVGEQCEETTNFFLWRSRALYSGLWTRNQRDENSHTIPIDQYQDLGPIKPGPSIHQFIFRPPNSGPPISIEHDTAPISPACPGSVVKSYT